MESVPQTKVCRKCGASMRKRATQGWRCNPCHAAWRRSYRAANRESVAALTRNQRRKNPARTKLQTRKRNLRIYGLTIEQFDALLAAQGGACAICRTLEPGGRGTFSVDHCHVTGKRRDILCFRCNTTLGRLGESPTLLRRMLAYLRKHRPALF